jgi:A1 cistron-splicing factor AAR2
MSKLEYDPNELFEAGGILLFFDVPKNTEFGIDYNCWRTGEKFKGVKMIPPGIHFIYFSVTDKYGNVGMRNGFFHNFKLKEVLAKKWNPQSESLFDDHYTNDELNSFRENRREFDKFLGPYPFDEYKRWVSLANNLSDSFLQKLIPNSKIISSGSILVGQKFCSTKAKESMDLSNQELFQVPSSLAEAEKRMPDMEQVKNDQINFSKIPTRAFPLGSTPIEITRHSIDSTYRLEVLLDQLKTELNLDTIDSLLVLCELQFSFICFLIGQVYEAFEQWKLLISLLCNSEQAIGKYPRLYLQFIQVVYFQLKEMPTDFFTDIITSNNFLVVNLHNLFNNIKSVFDLSVESRRSLEFNEQLGLVKSLNENCDKFKSFLEEKFKFNFDEEPDEYAPIVCEA